MSARKRVTHCDIPALFGAGYMGHTWVTTYVDAEGATHLRAQTSDGESAVRMSDESGDAERGARFFQRDGSKGRVTAWREVSRTFASIN